MGFIKSTLGHLTGARLFTKQASYIKGDFSVLTEELKGLRDKVLSKGKTKKKEKTVDLWNTVVINYGINATMMKSQYHKRRIMSGVLLCTFLISTYFVIVDSQVFIGLPSVFVSLIFYMNNALRLYQIRHHELCKWGKYFSAIKVSFKELLPMALPDDWQLMQPTQKPDTANNIKQANNVNKAKKTNRENPL